MTEETGLLVADLIEIDRRLLMCDLGSMLHFGFRARIAGGILREGDEGEARLIPKSDPMPISADRRGSRHVYDAYLAVTGRRGAERASGAAGTC